MLELIQHQSIKGVILTYPYFYENKPYCIDGIKHDAKYAILNDQLQTAILNNNDFFLYSVSSKKQDTYWVESYNNFTNHLKAAIIASKKSISFRSYIIKNDTHLLHAKFCIGFVQKGVKTIPAVLMLGSSNLTKPAFSLIQDFNYESDIVLWDHNLFQFNYDILESGNIKPIIAYSKQDTSFGNEREYIDYFYKLYKSELYNLQQLDEI